MGICSPVSVLEKTRQGHSQFEASLASLYIVEILLEKKKKKASGELLGSKARVKARGQGRETHSFNFASSRLEGPLSQKAPNPRDATIRRWMTLLVMPS